MPQRARDIFDRMLDQIIANLPTDLHELLEEVPLIVEDEPSSAVLEEMDMTDDEADLCGLHWGVPLTERGSAITDLPDRMMIFRGPIMRLAGFQGPASPAHAHDELARQIRITVLHEIGHHFGMDEDDLAALGYE